MAAPRRPVSSVAPIAMMPSTATATAPRRRRSWRWVLATLLVLAVIAGVDAYLSAPRPGTRMDAARSGRRPPRR
ncbi:hypothetical protein MAHJHV35_48310 [Mycobacterium avium subsp. hominissuis]